MSQHRPIQDLKTALHVAGLAMSAAYELCCLVDADAAIQLKGEIMRLENLWPNLEDFGDLEWRLDREEHDAQAEMAEAQNGRNDSA